MKEPMKNWDCMTFKQATWFTALIAIGIPLLAVILHVIIEYHKSRSYDSE